MEHIGNNASGKKVYQDSMHIEVTGNRNQIVGRDSIYTYTFDNRIIFKDKVEGGITLNAGIQLTPQEIKLFGIIRALDNPSVFLDRMIGEGKKQLRAE